MYRNYTETQDKSNIIMIVLKPFDDRLANQFVLLFYNLYMHDTGAFIICYTLILRGWM